MKRTSLTVILVFSLLGTPMPAQAANGMADMMSLMMEMFLWMMRGGGGGGGGFNPYGMGGPGGNNPYSMGGLGGLGNPMLASSMLGNPMLSNSLSGYPSGWGNTLPYAAQGLYQPFAYPGQGPYSSPYNSSYGSSYSSPHYGNNYPGSYGYQPYYRQGSTNPFYLNQYSRNPSHAGPYKSRPYRKPAEYNHYQSRNQSREKAAPVVIQPIIISPTQQPAESTASETELYRKPVETKLPDSYPLPAAAEPYATQDYTYNDHAMDDNSPLYGHWQGVNGEYMELGVSRFRLQSGDTDLQGTYQLKNGILKAEIPNRAEPVYMQYRLNDGYLMFLSEDGQKMLLRRLP